VFCVVGDGSALYTLQALWTQARERLNVVTVVLANRSYSILAYELERVGAQPGGSKARQMLDLSDPVVDFVSLAAGFGVAAVRARTAGELAGALDEGFATPGPVLIEANLLENQSSFG
jgi:acetolactate synthase-1/2/3 large subunit